MRLDQFNEADRDDVIAELRPCVDVNRWCAEIADGRPYATGSDLRAAAAAAALPFTAAEVEQALSHHPRIGDRARGTHAEAEHSRTEQAGVDPSDAAVLTALAEGNAEYERRFGRVFLIRAAGRSAAEILDALHDRLGNDLVTEQAIVAAQLREIALLRLDDRIAA
ncbi:2-oxo-4-hydroxy-4-carboxy-5-ureidoimidazoline decarboxylase [Agromyces sp. LHK192]|uniref:2-oxo-4-hydroxy-4-carboxy-5-ureidoimidazoline decarboxylase n=1 Tax=Agromyces sp. LHK192 TaxID=2498704 RepID=UPI000FD81450|nr:2-oxo-4-hydroxy-4-carboxy-5-ureidoimidazoline decarboxylase [Agromyces sp. LHK192]